MIFHWKKKLRSLWMDSPYRLPSLITHIFALQYIHKYFIYYNGWWDVASNFALWLIVRSSLKMRECVYVYILILSSSISSLHSVSKQEILLWFTKLTTVQSNKEIVVRDEKNKFTMRKKKWKKRSIKIEKSRFVIVAGIFFYIFFFFSQKFQ